MSEVVIRCPNCGTTQGALGECEACHEADTRYFCINHAPGRWLDSPTCSECGARFGVERVRDRPAPRPSPATPPRPRTEAPATSGRRRVPIEVPERTVDDVWHGPVRTPTRGDVEDIRGADPRVEWPPAPPFPPIGVKVVQLSGCVRKVIVLLLVLLALAALAVFGLLGVGARVLFGAAGESPPMTAQSPFPFN